MLASPSILPTKTKLSSALIISSSFSESSESEKFSSASLGSSASEPIPKVFASLSETQKAYEAEEI